MADESKLTAANVPYAGYWDHALSPEEVKREHARIMALVAARRAAGETETIVERNGVRVEIVNPSPITITCEGTIDGKRWRPIDIATAVSTKK
jgi:hypothetical protein